VLLWIGFIICSSAVIYSGLSLSEYGDIMAENTGPGGACTGVVLMGFITSLPELDTGMSSVTHAGIPDIAVGNVLGACALNMLTLALLDSIDRPTLSVGRTRRKERRIGNNIFLPVMRRPRDLHVTRAFWHNPRTICS
jgi:Ca2+/Na+ antiporter